MSYKIRNWSTSNRATNPSSVVGDCREVTVSITTEAEMPTGEAGRPGSCRKPVHVIRSTEKEDGTLHLKAPRNL